jgi:hypothetical protein
MEHRSPPVERTWTVGRAGCWSAPTHLAPDWSTVAFSSATAAARRSVRAEEALRPRAGSPGRCSRSSRKRARDAAAGEREGAERPGLRRLGLLAPFDVTRRIATQYVAVKMRLRRSVLARDGSVHCEIQLAFAVPRKVHRNRRPEAMPLLPTLSACSRSRGSIPGPSKLAPNVALGSAVARDPTARREEGATVKHNPSGEGGTEEAARRSLLSPAFLHPPASRLRAPRAAATTLGG